MVYSPARPTIIPLRSQFLMKPLAKKESKITSKLSQILGGEKKIISWEEAASSCSWMKSLKMGWACRQALLLFWIPVFQTHTRLRHCCHWALKRFPVFLRQGDPFGKSIPTGYPSFHLAGRREQNPTMLVCVHENG